MMNLFAGGLPIRLPVVIVAMLAMLHASALPAFAQSPEQVPPSYSNEQLEQLVAPIALYPDGLLTQLLMAAAYPLEIVEAARWREANPDVKGRDLEDALQQQPWDESVKALAAFPQALRMMNEKLDWTQQLGEAFLAQQDDVFSAVQRLRKRAEVAGNLKSTKQFRVTETPSDEGNYTTIESVEPEVVYVPVYDPLVVYGPWPYADYPPYYWYPHDWNGDSLFWFGAAVVVGTALWATWDWRHRSIYVDRGRYNSFFHKSIANPTWRFNAAHRKGVPFRASTLDRKFGPMAARGQQPNALQRHLLQERLHRTGPPKAGIVSPLTKTPIISKGTPKGVSPTVNGKSEKNFVKKPPTFVQHPAIVRAKPYASPAMKHIEKRQIVRKPTTAIQQHPTAKAKSYTSKVITKHIAAPIKTAPAKKVIKKK